MYNFNLFNINLIEKNEKVICYYFFNIYIIVTLIMDYIPVELWQYIHDMLDLKSQIYLKSTNKFFRYNLIIRDLLNIDDKFKRKLDQTIILNIANNNNIIKIDISNIIIMINELIDLSCLENLQVLHANNFNGIVQNTIKNLNLVELNCNDNEKITDVSFMKNLKVLNIGEFCGVHQNGIKNLDLVELNCRDNMRITDVSFMTNLKVLNIGGFCGVDQNGIKNLDLVELNCRNNNKITDVYFMTNLKVLNISAYCGVGQYDIKNLDLVELNCNDNKKITDVSFMTNLKILDIGGDCGVDQNGIKNLDLVKLNCRYNDKITDVSFMTNIKYLDISFNRGVDQNGIRGINPEELNINYNNKITNISHMNKLKKLLASGIKSSDFNKGMKNINPVHLDITDNRQINLSDIYHMTNLRTLYISISEYTNITRNEIEKLGFKLISICWDRYYFSRNI